MSYARVQTCERKVDYTKKTELVKPKAAFFHHFSGSVYKHDTGFDII